VKTWTKIHVKARLEPVISECNKTAYAVTGFST